MASKRFAIGWSSVAEERLKEIEKDTPLRAHTFTPRIFKATATLCISPFRCPRLFEDRRYRFLLVHKYRIVFRIEDESTSLARMVWIVTILYPTNSFLNIVSRSQ
jgi:hypothetical protein